MVTPYMIKGKVRVRQDFILCCFLLFWARIMDAQAVSQRAIQFLESWQWKLVMLSSMDSYCWSIASAIKYKCRTAPVKSGCLILSWDYVQDGVTVWVFVLFPWCCWKCPCHVPVGVSLFSCSFDQLAQSSALLCFWRDTNDQILAITKLIHS